MTLKIARAILLLFLVIIPVSVNANCNKSHSIKVQNIKQKEEYPIQVIKMANFLENRKKEYGLKYKNKSDLLDTLNKIWIHTRKEDSFTYKKIVSIAILESRLDRRAFNNVDYGAGLMMAMPKYWHKELPWYTNPYNKNQSIKASISILNILKKRFHCSTWTAIRYYNSRSYKSKVYLKKVQKIYLSLNYE